jgi:hypothetical protein
MPGLEHMVCTAAICVSLLPGWPSFASHQRSPISDDHDNANKRPFLVCGAPATVAWEWSCLGQTSCQPGRARTWGRCRQDCIYLMGVLSGEGCPSLVLARGRVTRRGCGVGWLYCGGTDRVKGRSWTWSLDRDGEGSAAVERHLQRPLATHTGCCSRTGLAPSPPNARHEQQFIRSESFPPRSFIRQKACEGCQPLVTRKSQDFPVWTTHSRRCQGELPWCEGIRSHDMNTRAPACCAQWMPDRIDTVHLQCLVTVLLALLQGC